MKLHPDLELAIAREVESRAPHGTRQYLKLGEVADALVQYGADFHYRCSEKSLWRYYRLATHQWVKTREEWKQVNGSREKVPVFSHYRDGKKGHRWVRTTGMTKRQLGSEIVALRKQQRGYDIRLRVYELIYDLLPGDDDIVGQVIS
jgi:hypothetical protein